MPKFPKSITAAPPGEYEVRVVNAVDTVSKNGNEMILLELSVHGSSRTFYDHLVFIESASWKIAQFLTAMGEEVTDDKDIKADDYRGRTARALVSVEEFNGSPQNKIEKWLPSIVSTLASIPTAPSSF